MQANGSKFSFIYSDVQRKSRRKILLFTQKRKLSCNHTVWKRAASSLDNYIVAGPCDSRQHLFSSPCQIIIYFMAPELPYFPQLNAWLFRALIDNKKSALDDAAGGGGNAAKLFKCDKSSSQRYKNKKVKYFCCRAVPVLCHQAACFFFIFWFLFTAQSLCWVQHRKPPGEEVDVLP